MAAYKAEKARVAAEILESVDEHWPGLSSDVEVTDVATPFTTWRYTRNRRGAFEGFAPTPAAVSARISRTLPGLRNFYMAGQWVMPGGGVPPVLFSGRHAIQLLCRSDGCDFVSRQA
jgi:phytoene desaturase